MSDCEFHDYSKKVVKDFLQTVALIDDRLWVDDKVPPQKLAETPGAVEITKEQTSSPSIDNSSINTKGVAESFAEFGMICGFYQPQEGNIGKLLKPAQRADCVILDWDLNDTAGKIGDGASDLINKIVEVDSKKSKRRRIIVIYTGHASEIEEIRKKTKEKCAELEWKDSEASTKTGLHIFIWSKTDRSTSAGIPVVKENELAERLIETYTKMSQGLLSNMVMAGITAIRDNTHALLERFSPELDPAFITHRIYSGNPSDSEDHAVSLIADEFQLILEENQVSKMVSSENCMKIVKEFAPKFDPGERGKDFEDTEWEKCLKEGLGEKKINISEERKWLNESSKNKREKIHKAWDKSSSCFSSPSKDKDFASMTILQQPYGCSEKILTLGTIIKMEESGNSIYLLCIQPLCDSLRIDEEKRAFPFLQLEAKSETDQFHLIFPSDGSYLRLKIDMHPFNCKMIEFPPTSGKKAVFTNTDSKFSDKDGKEYRWLGQLKWKFAQKVVADFASQTSRIGIDQSEWLRRQNPDANRQ